MEEFLPSLPMRYAIRIPPGNQAFPANGLTGIAIQVSIYQTKLFFSFHAIQVSYYNSCCVPIVAERSTLHAKRKRGKRQVMKRFIVHGLLFFFLVTFSGCTDSQTQKDRVRNPVEPVEIIAHRGASHLAPENTMASVMLGWEKGADVEVDVYLSSDNRIVVIHDDTTERTAGTDVKVGETTSQELRKLDVGSFKAEEFAGEQIPFLADIVRTIPPERKLYVEIKCGKEILPFLRELIVESGKMSQIVIIGFDLETVAMSKELIDIPTYWLKGIIMPVLRRNLSVQPKPQDKNYTSGQWTILKKQPGWSSLESME
jgi:hypothetical protein